MKIQNIKIENFRSLHDVSLDSIGNLGVLIGKNSSGKSNILEALVLFFDDFAITGGSTAGLNEYFWYNRQTSNPIEFTITIKLNESECRETFPEDILKFVREKFESIYNELVITRQIINVQGAWKTEALQWAELPLIKSDVTITPEQLTKVLSEKKTPPASLPQITPQMLSTIFTKITEKIKGRFKLIAAIRDVKQPMAHRTTLIDSSVQSRLWSLDQSVAASDESKYTEIENSFRRITNQRLDLAQAQTFIRKGVRRFPLYFEGGGIQAIINMIFELRSEPEKSYIFGIEEPESHSHPELQRRFFNDIKKLSEQSQIFLATHSPIFVDRTELDNTWIVKIIEGSETKIERIAKLEEIINEIGARPSDIFFFADRILFVEGKTEEIVLPAYAKQLGLDMTDVAIVSVEGKNKARLNLKTWIKITRNTLPLFLILDKDAKDAVEEVIKEGLLEEGSYHLWQKGSIEDYYPPEILEDALEELNSRYSLNLQIQEILEKIKDGELKPSKIDLGDKRNLLERSWKVVLGEAVAKLMSMKKVYVSDEIRGVMETFLKG
jgi:predicted ATP-dependent endonuclease of OLD family